ncbi:MAG: type II secretion system protein, partial [Proteobacteria bacterium]|nr:type II secretion system protein [Pseudomonadota bacterium]
MGTHRISFGQRSRAGFTIIELAIVIVVISVLLMPLLRIAASSIGATRTQETGAALETARDALVAFAASNNGCLPFAADFEGGLPDTDATGVVTSSSVDTGFGTADKHGGDLPWAELGLTNSFLDGEELRVQYYVASPYTDDDADSSNGIKCNAGFRGFEWNSSVTYNGSTPSPLYVYNTDVNNDRQLYRFTDTLPGGMPPDTFGEDTV